MSYLRLSPEEYRVLCRLCEQLPLGATGLTAFRHFLVAYMPLDQLELAKRIARLDDRPMRLLQKHLLGRRQAEALESDKLTFTEEELELIIQAIDFPRHPLRFLRHFQKSMVERLSDSYPSLAWKLARLSERQFERLYEHVRGRKEGSP
jgi:hypothetical protein